MRLGSMGSGIPALVQLAWHWKTWYGMNFTADIEMSAAFNGERHEALGRDDVYDMIRYLEDSGFSD